MIPDRLKQLVEQQSGKVKRTDYLLAKNSLLDLGVSLESEFAEFFLTYKITFFQSNVSDEELCDVAEPTPEIKEGTEFVQEVWELPENFICFTSVEGEGGYLYDKESGAVYDFDLAEREELIDGNLKPSWPDFYSFMIWYLS